MIPNTCTNEIKNGAIDEVQDDTFDVEKCAKWIDNHGFNKVCLQFPDHLIPECVDIAVRLEKHISKKVYILGDTTSGSCCVDEIAAQHINADSIIHYDHACLNPTVRLPVFHVLPKKELDVNSFLSYFTDFFADCTKILFFYDVAYAHKIKEIHERLSLTHKEIVFSYLSCTSNVEFTDTKTSVSAATLGRSFTLNNDCKAEDYEAFFLGKDGKTLATLAMSIPAKRWYCLENKIIEYGTVNTPWLKRRRFLVEKLKDAKVVGIVVATLGIKEYLKAITMVKNILKQKNKKSYILSVGKINPMKLANFPEIDAFVVIACPENDVFDSRDFLKPMLMPYEVELAFNTSRDFTTQYYMDFRQILPGGLNYTEFKPSEDSDVSLITGELRVVDKDVPCTDKMNALAINSPGTVAIGKAGAEFLQERSWKGVEQRLGKDAVRPAEIGRSGLPYSYENEPISMDKRDSDT